MKLYDGGKAPNPRRVRVYLAEKGITVPLVEVDMGAMGHRSTEVTARNPLQRLPMLELDDGTILTESVAICRYFEALYPDPPLFGRTPLESAQVEMWHRRIEFHLTFPVAQAFRHLHPAMKEWEVPQVPEWGEANKPKALAFLKILDDHLADHEFLVGEGISIADLLGMISIDFMKPARIALPNELTSVARWYQALKARPSAEA